MGRFTVNDTPLHGLKLIKRQALSDDRGYFTRFFCADELSKAGWTLPIAQINHTFTKQRGALRGMHYQNLPHAEKKLVSCIRGSVWDVAVDLRNDSPTFLLWHAQELSAANQLALLIPEGFAHGFQVLSDEGAELIYLHSAAYAPGSEAAINALDPKVNIPWPLKVTEISARDHSHALIRDDFFGVDCL